MKTNETMTARTTTPLKVRSQLDLNYLLITISLWVWILLSLFCISFNCHFYPKIIFYWMEWIAKSEFRVTPSQVSTSISPTISSNQSYIQWQNKSIPPNSLIPNSNFGSIGPTMWSYAPNNCTNSFSNYSYSTSTGVFIHFCL